MKNILFLLLVLFSIPAWSENKEKKKEPTKIDLIAVLEPNDERSAIFPLEAFKNDVELNLICWQSMHNATITIEGVNGILFNQTVSLEANSEECISLSGYTAGNYTLTITTPQGTYITGYFNIE